MKRIRSEKELYEFLEAIKGILSVAADALSEVQKTITCPEEEALDER